MNTRQFLMTTALMLALSAPAFAQNDMSATPATPASSGSPATPATPATPASRFNAGTETQRDVNQQNRVEQGLQSGQLSTGEASRLENGDAKIDKTEAKDMKDGSLSPREKARLQRMQNRESRKIYNGKHNAVKDDPDSASSQRMQKDVQRDANQQQRIHDGIKNGSLTNREAGRLERGQGRNDRAQARGGRDGHMGMREQRRMERRENHQGGRIHQQKHNRQGRGRNSD